MQESALKQVLGSSPAEEIEKRRQEEKRAAERADRLDRAERDFGFFCKYYLPHYFTSEAAEYQEILTEIESTGGISERIYERLQSFVKEKYWKYFRPIKKISGMVDVEPREHGKTVRGSFAKPLWRLLFKKNRNILLIGSTAETASENIVNIKSELEDNERLIEDFGDMKGRGKWTDTRLELENGTCVQSKGAGAAMRGIRFRQYRPDLVILDDIMKDDAAESANWRDKIYRWAKRVVFFLGKDAFILFVNTIFHSDDIVCRLLGEIEAGKLDDWVGFRFSCWKPDGTPLWPENWPKEALETKKRKVGSNTFSTEMENEPLSDEERIIRIQWIHAHWYEPFERPQISDLRRYAGIDPSTGAHDLMGIVSVGVDKQGIIWELDSWGERCSETQLVATLILKHLLFRYELIAWEDVAFQKIYKNYVMKLSAEKGVYLPIQGVKPGGASKESRIRKLSPLIENGIIRIRKSGSEELVDQLWNFPKHTYDDIPDALEMAVSISESPSIGPMAFPARQGGGVVKRILRGYRNG